jgi:hypothetical protein
LELIKDYDIGNQLPPLGSKCGSQRLESRIYFEIVASGDNRSFRWCK